MIDKEAFTSSIPKNTFKSWIRQKQRHFTTGFNYQFKHQFLLGAIQLSQLLFWFLFVVLLFVGSNSKLVLILFILKFVVQIIVFRFISNKLGDSDLIFFLPFYELFFVIFNPLLVISNFLIKRTKWT